MAPAPTLYGEGHQPRESSGHLLRPLVGGALCLDVINTTDTHTETPGFDAFAPGYVNVLTWFEHAGLLDETTFRTLLRKAAKEPRDAAAVRKRATILREALFEVMTAVISGQEPPDESLLTFNQEVHRAFAAGDYVSNGASLGWQWRDGRELERVLWEVCGSAVSLLNSDDMSRVRQCASPICQSLFLDTSKNNSRQFCSPATCGTAARVRRFRERQKAAI